MEEEPPARKNKIIRGTGRWDDAMLRAFDQACKRVRAFHQKLCGVRVLDPACGSGNFLYVTLEHMKRLEGGVLDQLYQFGDDAPPATTVDPHQFLGLELNGRAVAIAELVLWIGYLQWHFRVHGNVLPAEPVLKKFDNIVERDAVLAYDGHPVPVTGKMATAKSRLPGLPDNWRELVDKHTDTIFVWVRQSTKVDSATGRKNLDETKRVVLWAYKNPRPAEWPAADFIVGNPPFIGKSRLRESLGDGYAETLRSLYPAVPDSGDFVMFWWDKAASLARAGNIRRFGFITTNSIKQTFNRRVVEHHLSAKPPLSLLFAIPDHPWVDPSEADEEKASVRIAMTVGAAGEHKGELMTVIDEHEEKDGSAAVTLSSAHGLLHADLTVGVNVGALRPLKSNEGLTSMGMMLAGSGFILSQSETEELLKKEPKAVGTVVRRYRNGRDLTDQPREASVIDFCGLSTDEARSKYPRSYEIVLSRVKPERDRNRDAQFREKWWLFGRVRPEFRTFIAREKRYIATVETAKHRFFQFLETDILPDHSTIAFGLGDAFHLGVLSSRIHVVYALAAGGTLEDRPRYNKSRCFDPFPFPDCTEKQKARIRKLAEELDAHRKRAQQQHQLGLTDIYNVLEKLRAGEAFTTKDKAIHDAALVATLRQLHDDLDAAVADAYGWPWPLGDAEILQHVVDLNASRAMEEKAGVIRWLRPDYQAKGELQLEGGGAHAGKPKGKTAKKTGKRPWPAALAERTMAVEAALAQAERPLTAAEIATQFTRAKQADVAEILATLWTLGRARTGDAKGTFMR